MQNRILAGAALLLAFHGYRATNAQAIVLPNQSFEQGDASGPAGWVAGSGGETRWENVGRTGKHSISVSASPTGESLYWSCPEVKLTPNKLYRFSFWSKDERSADGCIISGPGEANHIFNYGGPKWEQRTFVFVAPARGSISPLRLGQWSGVGKVYFDDVSLEEVVPIFNKSNGVTLGDGESIRDSQYTFNGQFRNSNFSRPLQGAGASFNTDRWPLTGDADIIYKHQIGNLAQSEAKVFAYVGYYSRGSLIIEASKNGQDWVTIAKSDGPGQVHAPIPASLLPAKEIYVRLRADKAGNVSGDSSPGSFQVSNYRYTAKLASTTPDANGTTQYLTVKQKTVGVNIAIASLGAMTTQTTNAVDLSITSNNPAPVEAKLTLTSTAYNGGPRALTFKATTKAGAKASKLRLPYRLSGTGLWQGELTFSQNGKTVYRAAADFPVAALFDTSYGTALAGSNDLWWCDSTRKVWQERPLPVSANKATAVPISVARNEYEAVQIVAKPQHDVANVNVSWSDLTGPANVKIAAKNIKVEKVEYVNVHSVSDPTGSVGNWPDPLAPLKAPVTLKANTNQPFWVTVFAPKDVSAGVYKGTVKLSGTGWSRNVPLQVTVWDFALTDETHIKSALGLSTVYIGAYHKVEGDDFKTMVDKYYANYSKHRISPYVFDGYNSGIKVDWGVERNWAGGTLDKEQRFDGEQSLRIDDKSTTEAAEATSSWRMSIQNGRKYELKYAVRTGNPNQQYQITFNTYGADKKWISGNNLNFNREGTTVWQNVAIDVTDHLANPAVKSISISLRPAPWTEAGEATGSVWFDDLQLVEDGKQDILFGQGTFEANKAKVTPDQVEVDFADFDAMMTHAVDDLHITTYRLHLEGVGGGSGDNYIPGVIGPYKQGSEEYEILLGSYLKQLQEHLVKKQWIDIVYLYWFDEPYPAVFAKIQEMGDLIHRYAPGLKWMLTQDAYDKKLYQTVDIWCPQLNMYDPNNAAEMQNRGQEVWWYICTQPKAPYAGLFIDHAAIEPRLWLWQTWQNKVQGILIWDTSYWSSRAIYTDFPDNPQDPWKDPISWNHSNGLSWGNADGRFFYPPKREVNKPIQKNMDDPINSMRWEILRDGIEDYEYLWTLQQLVNQTEKRADNANQKVWLQKAKALLQVPTSISTTLTNHNPQPNALLQRRTQIAQAIVEGAVVAKQ